MAKPLFFGLLILLIATNAHSQNKVTFVCRVDSILFESRTKVEFTAIRDDNCEKITLGYGYPSFTTRRGTIKKGSWLTVTYKPEDCVNGMVRAVIKINN